MSNSEEKQFRVLAGMHANKYGIFKKGQIATDTVDLAKLEPRRFAPYNGVHKAEIDGEDERRENLLTMTVAELHQIARDEEVDLEGASKKADIIEKLLEHGV